MTRRERLQAHAERLRHEGLRYPVQWLHGRYNWERQQFKARLYGQDDVQSPALFRSQSIYDATERAEQRYNPGSYSGKTILLRPRLDRRHVFGPDRAVNVGRDFVRHDNGWSAHLPQLTIREVSADAGDHDGFVLEPAVRDLVSHLRQFLND